MFLPTENAISQVVIKRLGARWFAGVIFGSFVALFLLATAQGPDLVEQYNINCTRIFTFINIGALLLVTIVSATEIPYDISGRVLLIILSKPIRRYQYITGKFFGLIAVGAIYAIICSIFAYIVLAMNNSAASLTFFSPVLMIVLRVLAIAGLATMLSSSFSEVPTIAGCICGIIFSFGINVVALMLLKSDMPTTYKVMASPILYVMPSLNNLASPPSALADLIMGRARDLSLVTDASIDALFDAQSQPLFYAVFYAVTYALIFLGAAIMLFSKSEKVE